MGVNSASQFRVIDPILSTVVQGYTNAELVGNNLFPRVPVSVAGGKVIEFSKESFQTFDTQRAPGGNIKRIEVGYLGKPFALENHALEAVLPVEFQRDAQAVPGIDLASRYVRVTMDSLALGLELQQAALATTLANYDANHKETHLTAAQWSTAGVDPLKDVQRYKEAVRASIGRYPNTLLLSARAFAALQGNDKVQARFQYTSAASITTDMLANYFGVAKVIVGMAVSADAAGNFSDAWGNHAVLAYVPTAISGIEQPSYGYTYTMNGHPVVEQPYYDPNRKSWIYGVSFERAPVLSGITSGFLIHNVAA